MASFNTKVPNTEAISLGDSPHKQRALSALVDAAIRKKLLEGNRHDRYFCARIALTSVEGSGAWLTALPEDDERSWDAELFRIALKRWCRVPIQDEDTACPCCGGIMDRFGDHALTCPCKGDRTLRHNALRDVLFREAIAAGTAPEREKAGLLPARPADDGAPDAVRGDENEDRRRRPADVYLPRGTGGGRREPAALDWAVTSGLRGDKVEQAIRCPAEILDDYADFKKTYKDTEENADCKIYISAIGHRRAWWRMGSRIAAGCILLGVAAAGDGGVVPGDSKCSDGSAHCVHPPEGKRAGHPSAHLRRG